MSDAWSDFKTKIEANTKSLADNMDGIVKTMMSSIKTSIEGTPAPELPKGNLKSPNLDLSNQALQVTMQKYQEMIKVADDAYKSMQSKLASQLKMHEISQSEETAQLLAALDERHAAENAALDGELTLYARGTAQYQKVLSERDAMYRKYLQERQAITQKAAEAEAAEWQKAADQIASGINGQIKSILTGQETLKEAMLKISGDIALKFIQDQIKVTIEWLANQARILAGHVAAEAGMTAATTAGAAVRTAADVAAGNTSLLVTIGNALKSIFASAGQTSAEVTAAVAPAMGPAAAAAPAIGAAAGAATAANAVALVASADIGGYVTSPGLLYVHSDEKVVPAGIDQPYQGQGGGATINMSFNAVDGASVQKFFQQNGRQIAQVLAPHLGQPSMA
jgi:hypothetical protein